MASVIASLPSGGARASRAPRQGTTSRVLAASSASGLLRLQPVGRADLAGIGPIGKRLDPLLRLLDDLELTVRLRLADLRPEIGVGVLRVDLHQPFGRLILLPPGRLADIGRRDVLAAQLLDGLLEEMDLEICGLGDEVRDLVLAPALAERLDEFMVLRRVVGLEIGGGGEMPRGELAAHRG